MHLLRRDHQVPQRWVLLRDPIQDLVVPLIVHVVKALDRERPVAVDILEQTDELERLVANQRDDRGDDQSQAVDFEHAVPILAGQNECERLASTRHHLHHRIPAEGHGDTRRLLPGVGALGELGSEG